MHLIKELVLRSKGTFAKHAHFDTHTPRTNPDPLKTDTFVLKFHFHKFNLFCILQSYKSFVRISSDSSTTNCIAWYTKTSFAQFFPAKNFDKKSVGFGSTVSFQYRIMWVGCFHTFSVSCNSIFPLITSVSITLMSSTCLFFKNSSRIFARKSSSIFGTWYFSAV